uniref:SSD domain-containing protein n=1 Tax=Caenorhabditis tropicalis TaxID=1561998 RepID=A0A1I7UJI3_9PELO
MLISGSVLRAFVATCYLLTIASSALLTLLFYSEPVLFAFVITTVSLLVLSYPILCLFSVSRTYDLELHSLCHVNWIPNSECLEEAPVKNEKPSRLDEAFVYAYM